VLDELGSMISVGWIPKLVYGIGIAFLAAGFIREDEWRMVAGTLMIVFGAIFKWEKE
jgi:hypothetical protein